METNNNDNRITAVEQPLDNIQLNIVVNGHSIQLNFPQEPEKSIIHDVKRMMMASVMKP